MDARRRRRFTRSPCLRGKKPSKKNWSHGIPESTSAVTHADGPGRTSTRAPASRAASTSTWPGSETLGIPASEAKAIRSPASSRSTSSGARRAITFSSQRTSGFEMPRYARSFEVTRVSSQQITSASRKACAARGVRSPRLPIGVPTMESTPSAPATRRSVLFSAIRYSIIARSSGAKATRASHAAMRRSVFQVWKNHPSASSNVAS
ncbi:Uncharacterised protein [Collinsella intestinalis]|nr:Uncharacterised protein [Collinsella intestinalis]